MNLTQLNPSQIIDLIIGTLTFTAWIILLASLRGRDVPNNALKHVIYFFNTACPIWGLAKICSVIDPHFYESLYLKIIQENLTNAVWTAVVTVLAVAVREYYSVREQER